MGDRQALGPLHMRDRAQDTRGHPACGIGGAGHGFARLQATDAAVESDQPKTGKSTRDVDHHSGIAHMERRVESS